MSEAGNAVVFYQAAEYSTASDKLMGRHAASESFLRSWIRYTPFEEIQVMVRSNQQAEAFKNFFDQINTKSNRKATGCDLLNFEQLNKLGCLYLPDPNLPKFAHLRARANRYNHSLCGVTHTLASAPTLELLSNYITSPIYPWDALICTSTVVKQSVTSLFEHSAEYLAERFGTKLKVTLPQLPMIPLGVDRDTTTKTQREKFRSNWRSELQIKEDAIVFLFYGRLSFHAKANPFIMYRALQAVAEKTGKSIELIHAGWFANQSIEDTFKGTAQEWAPKVKSHFIDGRQMNVRNEIRYACDVFISLADNIQETFGLTPIEAMAAGLPSVVSDWNGYKDTVRHGMDGYRVPTTVPAMNEAHLPMTVNYQASMTNYDHYIGHVSHSIAVDLEKCIEYCCTLVNNPDLRVRFGEQAQARVAEVFTWEKVIQQYVELFKHLGELRRSSSTTKVEDKIHPVHALPFETFPTYPTTRIRAQDQFCCSTKQAQEDLLKIYHNPMFNYGGLDSLELMQKILSVFPLHRGIYLKQIPGDLGTPQQKDRVVCFLLKVGLIKKL